MIETNYSTKATWLGNHYACRVMYNNMPIVEGKCKNRDEIGDTFRDLLTTVDKMGGDKFTDSVRKRKFLPKNKNISTKHYWF